MKFLIPLSVFFIIPSLKLMAQRDTLECDAKADTNYLKTVPWYGNNNYLENFLDSIGYPSPSSRIVGTDRVKYRIPIKFWVYRNNAGTNGPTLIQLQRYIDNLNRLYNVENNTWIGFYMRCSIGYINDDSHLNVSDNITFPSLTPESWQLLQDHKEKGCINIHITDELDGAFWSTLQG